MHTCGGAVRIDVYLSTMFVGLRVDARKVDGILCTIYGTDSQIAADTMLGDP